VYSLNTHRLGVMWTRLLVTALIVFLVGAAATLPALAARPGTWTPTGNVKSNRIFNAMALLQNGQALVAGGHVINLSGKITTIASAELYSPTTNKWQYTGSLNAARESFTATLLTNGQVLAAGGLYDDPVKGPIALSSAELYNPITGRWTITGSLHTARWNHTATLLPDGEVLVAGGETFDHAHKIISFASAELYNPTTGRWTATGSLKQARYEQTATLLHTGLVLVAGGNTGIFVGLASAELYNPATGRWTPTDSMTTVRRGNTMTLLQSGQVLVAGGADGSGTLLASAELYNPATGIWSLTGNMPHPLDQFSATLLQNGQVLAAGGYDGGFIADAELYQPATGAWTPTGSMTRPHALQSSVLLQNGEVLIAGGAYNIFHLKVDGAEYYTL